MSQYHAPLADMQFVLNELAGLEQVAPLPGFEEADARRRGGDPRGSRQVRDQRARPAQRVGDREGAQRRDDGTVKTPAGFKDAYRQFCENGWNGLDKSHRVRRPGPAAPAVGTAVEEMWHASNLAFDLCAMLTQGAIEAIELRGLRCAEAKIPAEDGRRHVDRHDEPDRAAGGLGPRRGAHEGGPAGRRHVQAVRPEDLHHLRRARLHRQHHPPRARRARRTRREA